MRTAFGRRLRAARIAAGYHSAAYAASVLGLDKVRYRAYERGTRVPPLTVLQAIQRTFNISLDWLLVGTGETQRPRGPKPKAVEHEDQPSPDGTSRAANSMHSVPSSRNSGARSRASR